MKKLITELKDAHMFFIKESIPYVGTLNKMTGKYKLQFKDKLYYPVAYFKFMKLTIHTYINKKIN